MTVTKKTTVKATTKPVTVKAAAKPKPSAAVLAKSKASKESAMHALHEAGWNYAGAADKAIAALIAADKCALSKAIASKAFIQGHMARRLHASAKTSELAVARIIKAWATITVTGTDMAKAYAAARKALSRVRAANDIKPVQKRTKQPKTPIVPNGKPKVQESVADIIAMVPSVKDLAGLKAELAKHIVAIGALPKKNAKVADMAFNLVCNQIVTAWNAYKDATTDATPETK